LIGAAFFFSRLNLYGKKKVRQKMYAPNQILLCLSVEAVEAVAAVEAVEAVEVVEVVALFLGLAASCGSCGDN
jgi:2-keto-3-deoxy-L-rhamnonate aldolase RhmA